MYRWEKQWSTRTSLTGESQPVRKAGGSYVYAGTVLEEGEITLKVRQVAGASRYEKIVGMIENSEKLKLLQRAMQNIWLTDWFRILWQVQL